MSVLACSRMSCANIMCDDMLIGAYICPSCLEELRHIYGSYATTLQIEEFLRRGSDEDDSIDLWDTRT